MSRWGGHWTGVWIAFAVSALGSPAYARAVKPTSSDSIRTQLREAGTSHYLDQGQGTQVAAPPTPVPAADDEDEAAPQPAEPDFAVINLPTTLRLPVRKSNFRLTHRFQGDLTRGDFGFQLENLFGLDQGAVIGLEFRYAVMRHVEAVVHRSSLDRTIQFYGKYDGWHQSGSMPISVSVLGSVEGANNFRRDYAPAFGASISRTISGKLALYAVPMWVHNSAAVTGVTRDTGFLGMGGRLRFGSSTYVVGEVTPRIGGYAPDDAEYGFGIEKRVGGHVFQLNFTNGFSTTFAQVARGGFPNTLYLGFNLARKFF
jgi:Membrane bound beta barrel domain (DUF5777)